LFFHAILLILISLVDLGVEFPEVSLRDSQLALLPLANRRVCEVESLHAHGQVVELVLQSECLNDLAVLLEEPAITVPDDLLGLGVLSLLLVKEERVDAPLQVCPLLLAHGGILKEVADVLTQQSATRTATIATMQLSCLLTH